MPADALREAATILLAAASPATVRSVLRMLLDDTPPEAAPVQAPRATPPPPPARPQPPRPPLKPKQPDGGRWDARRREIRAAMLERGVSYPAMAEELGTTVKALQHALGKRQPPSKALQQQLEAWLESAPEVAAEPSTFRPNGAGQLHAAAAAAATDTAADAG